MFSLGVMESLLKNWYILVLHWRWVSLILLDSVLQDFTGSSWHWSLEATPPQTINSWPDIRLPVASEILPPRWIQFGFATHSLTWSSSKNICKLTSMFSSAFAPTKYKLSEKEFYVVVLSNGGQTLRPSQSVSIRFILAPYGIKM